MSHRRSASENTSSIQAPVDGDNTASSLQERYTDKLAEVTANWGINGQQAGNEVAEFVEATINVARQETKLGPKRLERLLYQDLFRQFVARGWLRGDQINLLERDNLLDPSYSIGPRLFRDPLDPNISYLEDASTAPPRILNENEIAVWNYSPNNLTPEEIQTNWEVFKNRWEKGHLTPYERQVLVKYRGVPEDLLSVDHLRENWDEGRLNLSRRQIADFASFDRSIFTPPPPPSHEAFSKMVSADYYNLSPANREFLREEAKRLQEGSPEGLESAVRNFHHGRLPREGPGDPKNSSAWLLPELVPTLNEFPINEYAFPYILHEWQKSLAAIFPIDATASNLPEQTLDQQKVLDLLGRFEQRRRDGKITPLERLLANAANEYLLPNPKLNPITGSERYRYTPDRGIAEAAYINQVLEPIYRLTQKDFGVRELQEVLTATTLAGLVVLIACLASYQSIKGVSPEVVNATNFFARLLSGDRQAQTLTSATISSAFDHQIDSLRQASLKKAEKTLRTENGTGVSSVGPGGEIYYEFVVHDQAGHHTELISLNPKRDPDERTPRRILQSLTGSDLKHLGSHRYFTRILVRQNTSYSIFDQDGALVKKTTTRPLESDFKDQALTIKEEPTKASVSELIQFGPNDLFSGDPVNGRLPIFGRIRNDKRADHDPNHQVHFLAWIDEKHGLVMEPETNALSLWGGPVEPPARYFKIRRLPLPTDPWVNKTDKVFNRLTHNPALEITYTGQIPPLFLNKTTGQYFSEFEKGQDLEVVEVIVPELFYDNIENEFLLKIGAHPDGVPIFATPIKRGGEWLYILGARSVIRDATNPVLDRHYEIGYESADAYRQIIGQAFRIVNDDVPRIELAATNPNIITDEEVGTGWNNESMVFRHFDKDGTLKYLGVSYGPGSQILFDANASGDPRLLSDQLSSQDRLSQVETAPTAIIYNNDAFIIDSQQLKDDQITYSNRLGEQVGFNPTTYRVEPIDNPLGTLTSMDTSQLPPSIGIKSPGSRELDNDQRQKQQALGGKSNEE